jgi:hypothetical protein
MKEFNSNAAVVIVSKGGATSLTAVQATSSNNCSIILKRRFKESHFQSSVRLQ